MSAIGTTRVDLTDIADDIHSCVIRVTAIGLIAEGILKVNKRHGNVLATAAEDLENELCRICELLEREIGK
jgi:hypothetical protein